MLAHKLLAKEDVLDNELRARIMEHLLQKPGSYLGKIGRELDVPTSTLKYHLNILKSFDLVTTVKKGRCRHYFPKKKRFTDLEKRMYAAIEHDPTRRIVEIIYRNPGISQGGLVKATGLSQSTVAWHMAKLEDMNLIRSHRNDVKEYYLRGDFETVLADLEGTSRIGAPPALAPQRVEAPTGTLTPSPETPPEQAPAAQRESPAPRSSPTPTPRPAPTAPLAARATTPENRGIGEEHPERMEREDARERERTGIPPPQPHQ